ncbi:MAG: class I SAM-dependent DNA methyltransferase [Faecalibacillus sp.]
MSYENFAYYYDSLMDQTFYDDYLTFILEHAVFHNVLELGCGTGEMAIRLSKQNKEVYATDISQDMLEVARLKAMTHNVDLKLARLDMCDFETNQQLDLILCLCDSLNYILNKNDILKVFKNVFYSLKNNGTFIFDVDSVYKMEVILHNYIEENDDEDFYFLWKVEHIDYGYIKHTVKIHDKIENDHVFEEHFQKTLDLDVYLDLLKKSGFKNIELYSDFNEYKNNCERVIFVCRKEEKS